MRNIFVEVTGLYRFEINADIYVRSVLHRVLLSSTFPLILDMRALCNTTSNVIRRLDIVSGSNQISSGISTPCGLNWDERTRITFIPESYFLIIGRFPFSAVILHLPSIFRPKPNRFMVLDLSRGYDLTTRPLQSYETFTV